MKNAPWLIILILIGIIIIQRSCSDGDCNDYEITDTVIIIEPGDTIVLEKEIPVPEPVYVKLPPDTILQYLKIDTAEILSDYYKKRFYQDTLKNDTDAFIRHDFSVFRNRLTNSKLFFQNKRKKLVIKQTLSPVESRKIKFYGGLSVGRKYNEFGMGLSLALCTRNDQLYALTYDVINKDVYFTIFWKIKFENKNIFTKRSLL